MPISFRSADGGACLGLGCQMNRKVGDSTAQEFVRRHRRRVSLPTPLVRELSHSFRAALRAKPAGAAILSNRGYAATAGPGGSNMPKINRACLDAVRKHLMQCFPIGRSMSAGTETGSSDFSAHQKPSEPVHFSRCVEMSSTTIGQKNFPSCSNTKRSQSLAHAEGHRLSALCARS